MMMQKTRWQRSLLLMTEINVFPQLIVEHSYVTFALLAVLVFEISCR